MIERILSIGSIFRLEKECEEYVEALRVYTEGADRVYAAQQGEAKIAATMSELNQKLWALKKKAQALSQAGRLEVATAVDDSEGGEKGGAYEEVEEENGVGAFLEDDDDDDYDQGEIGACDKREFSVSIDMHLCECINAIFQSLYSSR